MNVDTVELPWATYSYDIRQFPFDRLAGVVLAETAPDLAVRVSGGSIVYLQQLADDVGERRTWRTDQTSRWHDAFYAGWDKIEPTFTAFVHTEITRHILEPFYYQRVPTFRVHFPFNVAVGEFHRDAQYGHPNGETSWWVPLTIAHDTSSVYIEGDDWRPHAPDVYPGQMIAFDAVNRRHGNVANVTGSTRVSFDFRTIPARMLPDRPGVTEHTRLRFEPGGYYAQELITP